MLLLWDMVWCKKKIDTFESINKDWYNWNMAIGKQHDNLVHWEGSMFEGIWTCGWMTCPNNF